MQSMRRLMSHTLHMEIYKHMKTFEELSAGSPFKPTGYYDANYIVQALHKVSKNIEQFFKTEVGVDVKVVNVEYMAKAEELIIDLESKAPNNKLASALGRKIEFQLSDEIVDMQNGIVKFVHTAVTFVNDEYEWGTGWLKAPVVINVNTGKVSFAK